MDTTKKDETTATNTTDDIGTSELQKVAGGYAVGTNDMAMWCDENGAAHTGPTPNAAGWHYDWNLGKCVHS